MSRHPDPGLLKRRLTDLSDLGFTEFAKFLADAHKMGKFNLALAAMRETLAETPEIKSMAMKLAHVSEILRDIDDDLNADPACRICGCTQSCACENGCWWIEPNLCSNCRENSLPALAEAVAKHERRWLEHNPPPRFSVGRVVNNARIDAEKPLTIEDLTKATEALQLKPVVKQIQCAPDIYDQVVKQFADLATSVDVEIVKQPILGARSWLTVDSAGNIKLYSPEEVELEQVYGTPVTVVPAPGGCVNVDRTVERVLNAHNPHDIYRDFVWPPLKYIDVAPESTALSTLQWAREVEQRQAEIDAGANAGIESAFKYGASLGILPAPETDGGND